MKESKFTVEPFFTNTAHISITDSYHGPKHTKLYAITYNSSLLWAPLYTDSFHGHKDAHKRHTISLFL